MTSKQWFGASFLVIAGSITFMLIFAFTGLLMYQFAFQEQRFEDDTYIAGVDVSQMDRDTAADSLREAVDSWEREAAYTITWYDEEVVIPEEAVTFLIEPTIEQLMESPEQREGDLLVDIDQEAVAQSLDEFSFADQTRNHVAVDSLMQEMEAEAGTLPEEQLSWMLHTHLDPQLEPEETLLAEATRSGAATPALQDALGDGGSVTISGRTTFSTLAQLHMPGENWVEEEALAALGSAVFETVAATNFEIEERHQRYSLLDTVPAGFDAHLEQDRRDFQFYNPNDYAYELEMMVNGSDIYVALYGYDFPYDITVTVNESNRIESKTRVIYSNGEEELLGSESNSFASPGETEPEGETLDSGEDGFRVETVRTYAYDGALEDEGTELLAEDYYAPLHVLESRDISVREPEETEDAEDAEDFPWDPEDWNGDGGQNGFDNWDENGGPSDFDNWMENGGEDAYEDWIDEGSPEEFEEWIEENGESYPGFPNGGTSPGFPNGGTDPGFPNGGTSPGFDGRPDQGGGMPDFDNGNGMPGFEGGNSMPDWNDGAQDGTGSPGWDESTEGGFPGFDDGNGRPWNGGSQEGTAPGWNNGTENRGPGWDEDAADEFWGNGGTPPAPGGPGFDGTPDGTQPDGGTDTFPGRPDGAGQGNGAQWENDNGEFQGPGAPADRDSWFPEQGELPAIKGEE